MQTLNTPFVVAVVQAAPSVMDREATLDKACELILEAGQRGARLVAFPESFIPGYPEWVWNIPAGDEERLNASYAEFLAHAIAIPSDALDKICRIARRAKIYVVLGVSERNVEASGASLYSTLIFIDAQGKILGKHRKLVAIGGERLVWAQGDGSTLCVYNTPFGKLGGLVGGENYMPLARYALCASGVQIYIAATWQASALWLATLQHLAKEGCMFVLSPCVQQFDTACAEEICVSGAIVNPIGELVAATPHTNQEILFSEIEPLRWRGQKRLLDIAGHCARPDVFQLWVNRQVRESAVEDKNGGLTHSI